MPDKKDLWYGQLMSAWIIALSRRYKEPGYHDSDLIAEARNLSLESIRAMEDVPDGKDRPPSERAKELVEDIRRTDADDAWHLTFNDAAHEIEEYVYAKNEELTKIMDEYEDKIAEMEKALNDINSVWY